MYSHKTIAIMRNQILAVIAGGSLFYFYKTRNPPAHSPTATFVPPPPISYQQAWDQYQSLTFQQAWGTIKALKDLKNVDKNSEWIAAWETVKRDPNREANERLYLSKLPYFQTQDD